MIDRAKLMDSVIEIQVGNLGESADVLSQRGCCAQAVHCRNAQFYLTALAAEIKRLRLNLANTTSRHVGDYTAAHAEARRVAKELGRPDFAEMERHESKGEAAPSSRLVIDAEVSETSPVVRGTWVTVDAIVARIVDGWTWSDILRIYPELTEDDIRAALSHAIDDDGEPNGEPKGGAA